jgi:hypothetical protein
VGLTTLPPSVSRLPVLNMSHVAAGSACEPVVRLAPSCRGFPAEAQHGQQEEANSRALNAKTIKARLLVGRRAYLRENTKLVPRTPPPREGRGGERCRVCGQVLLPLRLACQACQHSLLHPTSLSQSSDRIHGFSRCCFRPPLPASA